MNAVLLLVYLLTIVLCDTINVTSDTVDSYLKVSVPIIYLVFLASIILTGSLLKSRFTGKNHLVWGLPAFVVIRLLVPGNLLIQRAIPLTLLIMILAASIILARNTLHLLMNSRRTRTFRRFIFLFYFPVLVSLTLLARPFSHPIGDEPYFLLITHSLIHDNDLNLENNYLQQDSLHFSDQALKPQLWDNYKDDQLVSRHSAVLPLLLAPGYFFFGKIGATVTMLLLTTWLAVEVFSLCFLISGKLRSSFMVTLAAVLGPPVIFYSGRIFTEIPGALCAVITMNSILSRKQSVLPKTAIAATLVAGLLKTRFFLLCFPLILIGILQEKLKIRHLAYFMVCVTAIMILIGTFNYSYYGSFLGRYDLKQMADIDFALFLKKTAGFFLDAQFGLLFLNPVILLLPAGLVCMFRMSWKTGMVWIFAVLPYLSALSAFAEMSGGHCLKGRFGVALLPFLLLPVLIIISKNRKLLTQLLFNGCMLWLLIVSVIHHLDPVMQIMRPGLCDRLLDRISSMFHRDLLGILPVFDRMDRWILMQSTVLLMLWGIVTLLILVFPPFLRYRTSGLTLVMSTMVPILAVASILFIGNQFQTPWMECEDPTFSRTNAQAYWEEPYQWEYPTELDNPYSAGVELNVNSSLTRTFMLRNPGHWLEIRAKGKASEEHAPTLAVLWNDQTHEMVIRSNQYQSYFLELPRAAARNPGPGFSNSSVVSLGGSSVQIDKIRILDRTYVEGKKDTGVTAVLPVGFGDLTLESLEIDPGPHHPGQTLNISSACRGKLDAGFELYLRLRQRYSMIAAHDPVINSGKATWAIPIPDDAGAGRYYIEVALKEKGRFIEPSPLGGFSNGYWAYIGDMAIDPKLMGISEKGESYLFTSAFRELKILPFSVHLGFNTRIHVPTGTSSTIKKLVLATNITDVWDMIPFESQIGQITFHSDSAGSLSFPLIIGRHSAEDKYEFTLKKIRLQHPRPAILASEPVVLKWPPLLEGKSYDSLVFLSGIDLPTPGSFTGFDIEYSSEFGILHLYCIGLDAQ